jgi:pimeloyl-ACP methyl ester carboxylesterase
MERQKVHFASGGMTCAAWHYPGTNGGCVIMAPGFAVTKEPGTDLFAKRFHEAGFTVLAFDYRRFGESGGQPRQIVRIGEQQADLQAAIDFARTLAGVHPSKIAIWGFSLSGGHVFAVASRNPDLAAAIAVSANADGQAASRNAMRHQAPLALLRLTGRGLLDALGGLFDRQPLLVPLARKRGTVAVFAAPDALNGDRALNPDNRYPDWQQAVAARSALRVSFYRPGRFAPRVGCPLLVLAYDQDDAALAGPAVRAGQRAPSGDVVRLPGGHYEPYMEGHEQAVEIQRSFLHRHLLDDSHASAAQAPAFSRGRAIANDADLLHG